MTQRITTKLCGELAPGVRVVRNSVRHGADEGISVSGNQVVMRLIKSGMERCRVRVVISLVPAGADLKDLLGGQDANLSWYRGIKTSKAGLWNGRDHYLTLEYNHPDDPCHWIATRLLGRRLGLGTILYQSTSPAGGGPIPQDGGLWCPDIDDHDAPLSQCRFVPGENLLLEWILRYGKETKAQYMSGCWFHTPAFSGGELLGMSGEGVDLQASVKVQGNVKTCIPTDFAAYSSGWVYVLKQGNDDATETDRQSHYGETGFDTDEEDPDAPPSYDPDSLPGKILLLVNQERAKFGLPPVTINQLLTQSAQSHTDWMAKNQEASHSETDGSTPDERIQEAGYVPGSDPYGNGENVAAGYQTAEGVMAGWMNSPGHRENILRPEFTDIGIGVAVDQYGVIYYTQNFGFGGKPKAATPEFRVCPVQFNDYGAEGDHENIDYHLDDSVNFPKHFEVSEHIGVITELWNPAVTPLRDAAKVDIEGLGSFDWVDIFYHCEGSDTVEGGIAAFSVGDRVLVLNEGGSSHPSADNLVIIGFEEGLKQCMPPIIVLFCYDYNVPAAEQKYMFVNIQTKEMFPVSQDGVALPQPFLMSDLSIPLTTLLIQNGLTVALQNVLGLAAYTIEKSTTQNNITNWSDGERISESPLIVRYIYAQSGNYYSTWTILDENGESSDISAQTLGLPEYMGGPGNWYYDWTINESTTFLIAIGEYWYSDEAYNPFYGVTCYKISNPEEWGDISDSAPYLYTYVGRRYTLYKEVTGFTVSTIIWGPDEISWTEERTTIAMGNFIRTLASEADPIGKRTAQLFAGYGIAAFCECQQHDTSGTPESIFWIQANRPQDESDPTKYQYRWDAFTTMITETKLYSLFGIEKESGKFITINRVFGNA